MTKHIVCYHRCIIRSTLFKQPQKLSVSQIIKNSTVLIKVSLGLINQVGKLN